MAAAAHRPILLADVDGVLNPMGHRGGAEVRGARHSGRIPDEVVTHARLLAESFDWWWCSAWEDEANGELADLLGLSARPVVRLTWGGIDSWKVSAVAATISRCAQGRGVAWMDDHIGRRAKRWAAQRSDPTLVVAVDAHYGLQSHHVAELTAFAAANTGAVAHDHVAPVVEGLGARRAAFVLGRNLRRRTVSPSLPDAIARTTATAPGPAHLRAPDALTSAVLPPEASAF